MWIVRQPGSGSGFNHGWLRAVMNVKDKVVAKSRVMVMRNLCFASEADANRDRYVPY